MVLNGTPIFGNQNSKILYRNHRLTGVLKNTYKMSKKENFNFVVANPGSTNTLRTLGTKVARSYQLNK